MFTHAHGSVASIGSRSQASTTYFVTISRNHCTKRNKQCTIELSTQTERKHNARHNHSIRTTIPHPPLHRYRDRLSRCKLREEHDYPPSPQPRPPVHHCGCYFASDCDVCITNDWVIKLQVHNRKGTFRQTIAANNSSLRLKGPFWHANRMQSCSN